MNLKTRRVRAMFTVVPLIVIVFLCAAPCLYVILYWDRLVGVTGKAHRRRIAVWQRLFGELVLYTDRFAMGITVIYDLPAPPVSPGPYVIISNHLGGFDGFLITRLLHKLGIVVDLRAIGKEQISKIPILGRAWREMGWGFVKRDHHKGDYEAVEVCGRLAHEDGANMLIFPEGTTFDPAKRRSGLTYVLPPKTGGLTVLRKLMPELQVLNVTIGWEPEGHGHSLFEGVIPFGRRAIVRARVVDIPDDPGPWLDQEWREKDAWIAARDRP